jgi:hypothetical protein
VLGESFVLLSTAFSPRSGAIGIPKNSSDDEHGGILSPPLSPLSSNLPLNQGKGLELFTHMDYFSETQVTATRSQKKASNISTTLRQIEVDDDPMKESTLLSITGISGGEGGGATSHANVSHTIHTITTRHNHW